MTLPDRELEAMQQILELLGHLDEEAQRRVTSWVQERVVTAHGVRPQDVPTAPPALNHPKARAFVERKAPRTMTERLVCLAYIARRSRGGDVRIRDLDDLNREVGGHVFSDAGAIAQSAVSKGYVLRNRVGHIALTAAGEVLVESLPVDDLTLAKPESLKLVARTLRDLLDAGVVRPGEPIEWRRPEVGQHYTAAILHEGMIVTGDGRTFSSLSTAASALAGGSYNGWACWTVPRLGGVRIGSLRGRSRGPTLG